MNLIDRVKNMLLTPKTEWLVVKSEQASVGSLLTGYIIPLSLIPAIITLLTGLLWTTITYGLISAIIAIIVAIIGYYVGTYVTDALAPSFSSEKNLNRFAQLTAYSYTAVAVASILGIIPILGALGVLAGFIYSVYLMYLGTGPIKNTPEDKSAVYVIVIVVIQVAVYFIINAILAAVLIGSIIGYGYRF